MGARKLARITTFNGDRLRSARIYRGMTLAQFAEMIQVTRQAVSQFEMGYTQPRLETIFRITSTLGFPREYFFETEKFLLEVGTTYFRALLTTNKLSRSTQIERMKLLERIYLTLNEYLEFPKLNLPQITDGNIDEQSIENIAEQVREYWGIGDRPILNMVALLEKNGVLVTSLPIDGHDIDAFSQRPKYQSQKFFFVMLGSNKNSATRRQFDGSHELGHGVLHEWYDIDLDSVSREEFHRIEDEANRFAGAFLLPSTPFAKDVFPYRIDLDYYLELKKKWRVSISAMVVRAHQLEVINSNQYRDLMRKISVRKWRTREPLDNELPVPEPTLFRTAIRLLLESGMSGSDIMRIFAKNQLTMDEREVEILLGLDEGTISNTKDNEGSVIKIR